MKTWKQFPKAEGISRYIECYWFLEKTLHDRCFSYPKLNPDPTAHLILTHRQSIHTYKNQHSCQEVTGNHWIFPHLTTFTMNHAAPFKIIGIKFKVGALYSVKFGHHTILNEIRHADTQNLFNPSEFNQDKILCHAEQHEDQIGQLLDTALEPWLSKHREDRNSLLARQILTLLDDTTITEMGGKLHRSQRTLERTFKKVTGLSMKQVQSMNRLENILNHLHKLTKEEINWADIAKKYDFSDQAHFIRHLKDSIGSTPSHYSETRDLAIDIYGNFEYN